MPEEQQPLGRGPVVFRLSLDVVAGSPAFDQVIVVERMDRRIAPLAMEVNGTVVAEPLLSQPRNEPPGSYW